MVRNSSANTSTMSTMSSQNPDRLSGGLDVRADRNDSKLRSAARQSILAAGGINYSSFFVLNSFLDG